MIDLTGDSVVEEFANAIWPAVMTVLICAVVAAVFYALYPQDDSGWGGGADRAMTSFGLVFPILVVIVGFVSGQGFTPLLVLIAAIFIAAIVIGLIVSVFSKANASKDDKGIKERRS